MDAPQKMWSPSGQETKMDEFRERVNTELKLTLSKHAIVQLYCCNQPLAIIYELTLHASSNNKVGSYNSGLVVEV